MSNRKKQAPVEDPALKYVARQIYIPRTLWDVFRAVALMQHKDAPREYIAEAMRNQLKMDMPKMGMAAKLAELQEIPKSL